MDDMRYADFVLLFLEQDMPPNSMYRLHWSLGRGECSISTLLAQCECVGLTMWTVGVMEEYSKYFWSGDRQVSVTVQRRFLACTSLRRRQSFSVS